MESDVQISITCKGLWSPETTGDEKNLVAEIKELLSELLCLEKVEIVSDHQSLQDELFFQELKKKVGSFDENQQQESSENTKKNGLTTYDLHTKKGKEMLDMILILRSLGATEDLLRKVVQVNCGVELSSLQRASL